MLQKDLEFLRSIEKYAFDLVLSEESEKPAIKDVPLDELKSTLDLVKAYGSTLFVTDQILDDVGILEVAPDELDKVKGEFKCVVVNLNESLVDKKDDQIANMILNIVEKVKVGGLIFVPESTWCYLCQVSRNADVV